MERGKVERTIDTYFYCSLSPPSLSNFARLARKSYRDASESLEALIIECDRNVKMVWRGERVRRG